MNAFVSTNARPKVPSLTGVRRLIVRALAAENHDDLSSVELARFARLDVDEALQVELDALVSDAYAQVRDGKYRLTAAGQAALDADDVCWFVAARVNGR